MLGYYDDGSGLFDDSGPAPGSGPSAALPSGFELAKLSIRENPDPILIEHLSNQLDAVQKLFGYRYGRDAVETASLTNGLARFLASYDVRDIRDVQPCRITIADWSREGSTGEPIPAAIPCNSRTGVHLYNYRRGFLEDHSYDPPRLYEGWIGYANSETPNWDGKSPLFTAIVELPNRYYVIFSAKWTDGGVPYFIPQLKRHSSIGEDLRFLLGAALMAIPGVNAVISSVIFPTGFAAAYPAVASIATNTLISATLNGGDIEAAVASALSGHVGGIVGGQAGALLDSQLVGRLASVATSTALQGGDIDAAVQNALLRYGAGAAGDFVADVVETAQAQPGPVPVFDIDLEADAQAIQTAALTQGGSMDWDSGVEFGSDFGDFGIAEMQGTPFDAFASMDLGLDTMNFGDLSSPLADNFIAAEDYSDADLGYGSEPSPYIAPENFSDADFDYNGTGVAPSTQAPYIPAIDYADADFGYGEGVTTAPAPVPGSVPPSGGYSFADGIRDVSSLAMAAIQVNAAFQRSKAPAVQAGSRTSATGNTVTGQNNGMVTVRSPSGQVVAQKPPVGVPYGTADGSVIVNNGDGTYTIATNTGTTQTRPYSQTSGGGVDGKTIAIGVGVAALALLALR